MQIIAIILLCIVSAVMYGIVHDQVTVRICLEYFTIGHPPVFATTDPTLLGIGWGIIATWWAGLLIGLPLAFAARFGSRPKRAARSLIRPVMILFIVMAVGALVFGTIGYFAARNGMVTLLEPLASRVPVEKHIPFIVDLWAHSASYFIGLIGGIVLSIMTWRSRRIANAIVQCADPPSTSQV